MFTEERYCRFELSNGRSFLFAAQELTILEFVDYVLTTEPLLAYVDIVRVDDQALDQGIRIDYDVSQPQ